MHIVLLVIHQLVRSRHWQLRIILLLPLRPHRLRPLLQQPCDRLLSCACSSLLFRPQIRQILSRCGQVLSRTLQTLLWHPRWVGNRNRGAIERLGPDGMLAIVEVVGIPDQFASAGWTSWLLALSLQVLDPVENAFVSENVSADDHMRLLANLVYPVGNVFQADITSFRLSKRVPPGVVGFCKRHGRRFRRRPRRRTPGVLQPGSS